MVTLPKAKRDELNDEQLDQVEETVYASSTSVEFKGLAATSDLDVSTATPLSEPPASPISSGKSNFPTYNEHHRNQDNVHANVLSRPFFTSAKQGSDMIYLDQVSRNTISLDKRFLDALSSATVSCGFVRKGGRDCFDADVSVCFSEREKVSSAGLEPMEIVSSKVTPSPQFFAATLGYSKRQVDTIVST